VQLNSWASSVVIVVPIGAHTGLTDGMRPATCEKQGWRTLRLLLPRELTCRTARRGVCSFAAPLEACRLRQVFGLLGFGVTVLHHRFPSPKKAAQCANMVRSQLPLRGNSGITPDSLLGLADVPDTAMDHKILCLSPFVNANNVKEAPPDYVKNRPATVVVGQYAFSDRQAPAPLGILKTDPLRN
jgi:hypothetical protein